MYYFDWTFIIIVLPAVLLSLWSGARVKGTFAKYSRTPSSRHITGAQAAQAMLRAHGITDVQIYPIDNSLGDFYDPTKKIVKLSVYNDTSIAGIGVACHEIGHAIQHAEGYAPVKLRSAIIPVTNFGSKLSMPLIIIGFLLSTISLSFYKMVYAGILCFALCAVFQLVTLPVEFNASRRAIAEIENLNLLTGSELKGARKVLRAAALTYVAALAVSLAQLFRLILIFGGNRRD